jgi:5-methylcytosine-specific restriction endonuclease McrA
MHSSKYMERIRIALEGWTDDNPPSVAEQRRIFLDIEKAKRSQASEAARRRHWLAGAMAAFRPPRRISCGASRYVRRLEGLTYREIAEQDGVTDGAVALSIRWYADRAGVPIAKPPAEAVTAPALAAAIGVRSETVNEWAARGLIPSVPRGKHRRFVVDAVRAALDARGWKRGAPLHDPSGVRGAAILARREQRASGVLLCSRCEGPVPIAKVPPSMLKNGGCWCPDCRSPSKRAADVARRRMKAGAQVEPVSHLVVAERDGWRCAICRRKVTRANWSLDHVVPVSQGGAHTYANVVLAHRHCNSLRGAGRFPVQAPLFPLPPWAT